MVASRFPITPPMFQNNSGSVVVPKPEEPDFEWRFEELFDRHREVRLTARRPMDEQMVEFVFAGPAEDRRRFLVDLFDLMSFPSGMAEHPFAFRVVLQSEDQAGLVNDILTPFAEAGVHIVRIGARQRRKLPFRPGARIEFFFGLDGAGFAFLQTLGPILAQKGRFDWFGVFN
jgi:hypothetical protein